MKFLIFENSSLQENRPLLNDTELVSQHALLEQAEAGALSRVHNAMGGGGAVLSAVAGGGEDGSSGGLEKVDALSSPVRVPKAQAGRLFSSPKKLCSTEENEYDALDKLSPTKPTSSKTIEHIKLLLLFKMIGPLKVRFVARYMVYSNIILRDTKSSDPYSSICQCRFCTVNVLTIFCYGRCFQGSSF